jgi:hypothetical protein
MTTRALLLLTLPLAPAPCPHARLARTLGISASSADLIFMDVVKMI